MSEVGAGKNNPFFADPRIAPKNNIIVADNTRVVLPFITNDFKADPSGKDTFAGKAAGHSIFAPVANIYTPQAAPVKDPVAIINEFK